MAASSSRKLLLIAALVLAANSLDLLSTYVVSPDLAEEWNALQRVFGLGWSGLIAAKLIGGTLAIVGYAYYLRYRSACYPAPGADLESFCRFLAYGVPARSSILERRPGSWRHIVVNLGYFWAGMQALVVWVALDNLLLRYGIVVGFRHHSEMGYHMLQSAIVASVVLVRFYLGNYRRYRELEPADPSFRPSEAHGYVARSPDALKT